MLWLGRVQQGEDGPPGLEGGWEVFSWGWWWVIQAESGCKAKTPVPARMGGTRERKDMYLGTSQTMSVSC